MCFAPLGGGGSAHDSVDVVSLLPEVGLFESFEWRWRRISLVLDSKKVCMAPPSQLVWRHSHAGQRHPQRVNVLYFFSDTSGVHGTWTCSRNSGDGLGTGATNLSTPLGLCPLRRFHRERIRNTWPVEFVLKGECYSF